jgi:ribosomal-protein-serine acetyltransferase
LPWPDETNDIADTRGFVDRANQDRARGSGIHYVIESRNILVGIAGFSIIIEESASGRLGYWLAEKWQGRGIMTRSCRALTSQALNCQGLQRVEIRCGVDNIKSRAVAERLQFRFSGIELEAERLREHLIDHAVYFADLAWAKEFRGAFLPVQSFRNSDAGVTPVIKRRSLARVQATYKSCRSVS